MSQPHSAQSVSNESDIQLALFDIKSQRIQSVKRAAEIYNVSRTTIRRRRAGTRPQRDCEANLKRLDKLEEEAIVKRILKESTRGFAPTKADVRAIADKLLHKRESNSTSKN